MSYRLIIGEKNYSSWSMRAWMLMRHLGLPFEETTVSLYRPESRAAVQALGGETGLVPVLRDGELAVWDTLALFEYLHEKHGGVWPADPAARAHARSLAGEIHSGFNALRAAMPANTRARNRFAEVTPAVQADIDRAADLWTRLPSPWLFGDFSGADVMFAPVACRFQTYGVTLDGPARDYYERLLAHPLVTEWLALGAAETNRIEILERPPVVR